MKKLIPYSVYLPVEYHDKIKELAKQRKASSMVRDAICMIVDGDDTFKSGYNKALKDCVKEIDACKEIEHIAVRGKYLADLLADQIKELEMR
jgi:bisphosphoglycerate-independent phosphoglycerate mutase (AlkP superfamily)